MPDCEPELCNRCGARGSLICERIETASKCPIGGVFCTQEDIESIIIAGHENGVGDNRTKETMTE